MPKLIMRINALNTMALCALVLSACWTCAAVTPPAQVPTIQLIPESSFLKFQRTGGTANLNEASVPVHLAMTGATVGPPHTVLVYACVTSVDAMRLAGKASTLTTSSLRILNDRGEWAALEPLPELEGSLGVRIAVVHGASATLLLQVQLQVPTGQKPGAYQGVLTLEAQER